MGNCLITQLKGSVENSSLLKLGEMKLRVSYKDSISYNQMIVGAGISVVRVRVDGAGYFATTAEGLDNDQTRLTYIEIPAYEEPELFFLNGDYNIIIGSKYNVSKLYTLGNESGIICDGVKYMAELRSFRNLEADTIFDLSEFSDLSQLEFLGCDITGITGNIVSLGKCTRLREIYLNERSSYDGSLKEFVDAQIANGRASVPTSSPLFGANMLSIVPFLSGGTKMPVPVYNTFITWDNANKIIVYMGGSGIASCNIIHAYGATPQEIAAWQAAGKTVTDVSTGTVYPPTNA